MEENKREIGVDLNDLIRKTYNKIALWNNEEGTPTQKSDMLKFVSHEIVEDILTEAFAQLEGVETKVKLVPGEPVKEKKENNGGGLFGGLLGKNKKKKEE